MASKEVFKSFDCMVTAVAMDEKFILVGQEDGNVAAFWWNGTALFETQVSDSMISAVCCDQYDEGNQHIFFAADNTGMFYTLNRKGELIADIQAREDRIHTLLNASKDTVSAYSNTGWTRLNGVTGQIKKVKTETGTANYSLEGDGDFLYNQDGQFHVNQYNCKAPSTCIATCGLTFSVDNPWTFAFGVVDPNYFDSLDSAEDTKLPVYRGKTKFRTITFDAPVIQVMSREDHKDFKANEIYFLLRNNTIVKMKPSQIKNKAVKTADLDRVTKDVPVDDEDAFILGFAVFGSKNGAKMVFQGLDEIFAINPNELDDE